LNDGFSSFIIIGAGQLGSRHAQALSKLNPNKITIVDPSIDSIRLAKIRLAEVGFSGILQTKASLKDVDEVYELAVISTASRERLESLKQLMKSTAVANILLEKLLTLSTDELDEFQEIKASATCNFWVNLPMPYFKHYKSIHHDFSQSGDGPLRYSVSASNLGLVTNFIHYLDHFHYLIGRKKITTSHEGLLNLIPSKRQGYMELLGTLTAKSMQGDFLEVTFSDAKAEPSLEIEIQKGSTYFSVDEINSLLEIHGKDGTRLSRKLRTPLQSELTHHSLEKIRLGLPPDWAEFDTSLYLHRLLSNELSLEFGPTRLAEFT